jgi:hypothetical protein
MHSDIVKMLLKCLGDIFIESSPQFMSLIEIAVFRLNDLNVIGQTDNEWNIKNQ